MPANIGHMFYTGDLPWHGLGTYCPEPVTVAEALKHGGLLWRVDKVDLETKEVPSASVLMRKAIVRLDRPKGDKRRVLGVAHRGFAPLQNEDGALLFDAIFGQGRPVYHTGGYLKNGEVVWLLAKIDRPLEITPGDVVQPYALYTNSHDGSVAIHMRLTTVRVVCQNTLVLALSEKRFGHAFRRSHQGSLRIHAAAAQAFFRETIQGLQEVALSFSALSRKGCRDETAGQVIDALLPLPGEPRGVGTNPGLKAAWDARVEAVKAARVKIKALREVGNGANLPGSRGTFWGLLNAVLEFVDHHQKTKEPRLAHALLGDGMELKVKAFREIQRAAAAA